MFEGLRLAHWRATSDADRVVRLTLDRADHSVNALGRAVLEELGQILERLAIDPPAGVVIHSGKPAGFIVGADLNEFAEYERSGRVDDAIERGQRVFEALAQLPCPTVAAIHGHCMGGGTELALACRSRVASNDPSTRIGLPEVNLGIFPGWGGSARLPRLIGAPAAMEMMLTGRAASASRAKAIGLVDRVVDQDALLEAAHRLALQPASRPLPQRLTAWATNLWPARQLLAPMMRRQTAAKVSPKHYPAPFRLIDTWRRGSGRIEQRLRLERNAVVQLTRTPTCRNLLRVFFLQERLKGLGGGVSHGIERVHVIGAGIMGGDIAAWAALQGFQVTLQDHTMAQVEPALARAAELFRKRLRTTPRIDEASARLKADIDGTGIAAADLVIEAIYENREAKQELYRSIEAQMKPDALLASNTSSIPLAELRDAVAVPSRFLGLHYFNPVAAMPLVEVVRHDQLDPTSQRRGAAFCRAQSKLPVVVAGSPGFLVNRILVPYMLESARALSEGVPGAVLDRAARAFGMPMGPIELIDTVGLDVAGSVADQLAPFLGLEVPAGLAKLLDEGRLGKKSGAGFYIWQDGKPVKPEAPRDYKTPADLEDRIILPMLNEAVACLHDGVVEDADLLDAGVIFGTGFAPFHGGPLQYIRSSGVDAIRARLAQLEASHGERFALRPGWDSPALKMQPTEN